MISRGCPGDAKRALRPTTAGVLRADGTGDPRRPGADRRHPGTGLHRTVRAGRRRGRPPPGRRRRLTRSCAPTTTPPKPTQTGPGRAGFPTSQPTCPCGAILASRPTPPREAKFARGGAAKAAPIATREHRGGSGDRSPAIAGTGARQDHVEDREPGLRERKKPPSLISGRTTMQDARPRACRSRSRAPSGPQLVPRTTATGVRGCLPWTSKYLASPAARSAVGVGVAQGALALPSPTFPGAWGCVVSGCVSTRGDRARRFVVRPAVRSPAGSAGRFGRHTDRVLVVERDHGGRQFARVEEVTGGALTGRLGVVAAPHPDVPVQTVPPHGPTNSAGPDVAPCSSRQALPGNPELLPRHGQTGPEKRIQRHHRTPPGPCPSGQMPRTVRAVRK